jgi:CubicO group peptidase (beta-lactamase class C family)
MLSNLFLVMPRNIPLGDYTQAIDYADRRVRSAMRDLDLPSVSVALIDDQAVVWHESYGVADLATGESATPDTIYKIGSITKVFIGLEIMRLAEEGLIDLDAPLESYMPGILPPERWPAASDITLRSILAHRSGIPRNDTLPGFYWDAAPDVLEAQVQTLAEMEQALPPGSRYKYSNLSYNVLGRLVEVARGLSVPGPGAMCILPYYAHSELFAPLGMNSTALASSMLVWGRPEENPVATGYFVEDGTHKPHVQYDIIELGSGSAISNLADMERFAHFILAGGVNTDGERIIDAATLNSMFEPQYARDRDPQANGLAWFTDDVQLSERVVFHDGTNQGFSAMFAFAPASKVAVVLLSNSLAFEDEQKFVAFELLGLLIQTKTGVRPPEVERRPEVAVPVETLGRYTGTYSVNGDTMTVSLNGDRLDASYDGRTVRLRPVAENRFELDVRFVDVGDTELSFFVDDPLEPDLMILSLGRSYHITCPRYPAPDGSLVALQDAIAGSYVWVPRHPSTYGSDSGTVEITAENGTLRSSDGMALLPLSDTRVQIVGGVFDGEIMERDPATGDIVWQAGIWTRK